ncbi:MAG TPA: hypothetical protein DET40_22240 [Lentisphaeria bacterium]|nr:MAG: hypothetical protein A2X45_24905 [Lentisphaerae bacterium GWF2_50_93]HCE46275.1 hypothetical protein [Lentisphaeria bacterium]
MKIIASLIIALSLLAISPAVIAGDAPAAAVPSRGSAVPPELLDKTFLYEITRHLYRWYLDEIDIENIMEKKGFTFKLHMLNPKLDDDDKSIYAEIFFPDLKICVTIKKADYKIEELGIEVKSKSFKITNVGRYEKDSAVPADCTDVDIDMKEMKDYLFKTRMNSEFPTPELYERIRMAFRKQFNDEFRKKLPADAFQKDWVTFVAPLSPVANEFWAFWDNGKLLVRCSSDIELTNPAVWEHDSLSFKVYDLRSQVVISLAETAGDNSFMTRDQIGRALFNCVVIGDRLMVKKGSEQEGKKGEIEKK